MSDDPHERRPGSGELRQAVRRRGSFWRSLRAVAWSFFGVRKGSDYERDVSQLNPVHVVIAGIVAALLFVLALVLLVRWVVGSGVAAA
ncbi:DUF2970 domain-containing protein [Caldimonas tepidiphila]|uniref:DUF2970 domain-containing protein n=1 Tax=Caldimonas tepidiphila TaxID=2315841 RepID=UPI000E5A14D0|nr:DUF2970 domain-containing protein [Caldimonas tepidiphila]